MPHLRIVVASRQRPSGIPGQALPKAFRTSPADYGARHHGGEYAEANISRDIQRGTEPRVVSDSQLDRLRETLASRCVYHPNFYSSAKRIGTPDPRIVLTKSDYGGNHVREQPPSRMCLPLLVFIIRRRFEPLTHALRCVQNWAQWSRTRKQAPRLCSRM
jgi:hypothetical protein